ncbi:MAG: hypothetical protein HRT43_07125 [Campylobacteraceae bacterium]|nr:hypothetical protein [Campylobacteraceae bacterium]
MKNLNKKSTRNILEDISQHCFTYMVPYKYGKQVERGSLKYKKGRITTYEWINNLTYYYIKQEENLKEEFIFYLKSKSNEIQFLKDGDYKKGIKDTLNEILEKLEQTK